MTTLAFTESFVVQEKEDSALLTECATALILKSIVHKLRNPRHSHVHQFALMCCQRQVRYGYIDSRFICVYGDAMICDDGSSYAYENECSCGGHFICFEQSTCLTAGIACPVMQPEDDALCTGPFVHENQCFYGQICCPGKGGICIPDKVCSCSGSNVSCVSTEHLYPDFFFCQSVCPEEQPLKNVACDIDDRFRCIYGNAVICDDNSIFNQHDIECSCLFGSFHCRTLSCPKPLCPETQPTHGDDCSDQQSFYGCEYGPALVCDLRGYVYNHNMSCYCDYNHTVSCASPRCPVPCPETEPTDGDSCSDQFPRFTSCPYGKFCCPGEEGNCVPDKEYYCDFSVSITHKSKHLLCSSVCPKMPPAMGDVCNIDSRYDCVYGNSTTCDHQNIYGYGYEKYCNCLNGRFSCTPNTCSLPCPEIPPDVGDPCADQYFFNGLYGSACNYGLKCCPGEGGDCVYKYEKVCSCFSCDLNVQCTDDKSAINCPSVCPKIPPKTNHDCHLDSPQYSCKYTYPLVKDEPGYSIHTKECVCNLGKFKCSCSGNACPTHCPKSPLVQGDKCSVFDGGYCNYTKPCCFRGGGGLCIANSTCFCDEPKGSVNCTNLPLTFCTSKTNSTITSGGTGGQMNVKKKKLRKDVNTKKPMHSRNLGDSGH